MAILNVLIECKPDLYSDLFGQLFQRLGEVNVLRKPSREITHALETVDVAVLSVNKEGQPDFEALPELPEATMLVAFSPNGELGFLRKAGEANWSIVTPFGLDELVKTVLGKKHNGSRASGRD